MKNTLRIAAMLMVANIANAQQPPTQEPKPKSLRTVDPAELHSRSAGMFVGTVISIDEQPADNPVPQDALTAVEFQIEKGLSGKFSEPTIVLVFRGGRLPDGSFEEWSHIPQFVMGQKYVVALRDTEYTLSPVGYDFASLMRVVDDGNRDVLVDRNGFAVRLDANGHLKKGGRVAAGTKSLWQKAKAEERLLQSVDATNDHPEEFPVMDPAHPDIDDASTLIDALTHGPANRGRKIKTRYMPNPLNNDTTTGVNQ